MSDFTLAGVDLLSNAFRDDPYPTYERLRAEAPLFRHSDDQLLVSRYDDVAAVLRDPARCSSAPMGGIAPYYDASGRLALATGSMIGTDPPHHARIRALLRDRYRRRGVAEFEPLAEQVGAELVRGAGERDSLDVIGDFAVPFVERVTARVAGIDEPRFSVLAAASRADTGASAPERELAKLGTAASVLSELVSERRACHGDDVISTLVAALHRGELSFDETVATSLLITVSGVEKIPALIGNALLALLDDRSALAAVRANPALVDAALDETLRYDPPVQMISREARTELTLAGRRVEPGTVLGVLIGSANRDERRFADPAGFRLDRRRRGHLGFGVANHVCIGEGLARILARTGLRTLLLALPPFELASTPVPRRRSLITRGPLALELSLGG